MRLLLALLLGCATAEQPPNARLPPAAPGPSMSSDPENAKVDLEWSLAKRADGSALDLSYAFTSHASQRVYVCDQLTVSQPRFHLEPDRLVAINGAHPGQIAFTCGAVSPDDDVFTLPRPVFAPLEPGATLRSTRRVPLPITSWNNAGRVDALQGVPTEATLTVDWFIGEPASWRTLKTADGTEIAVPETTSLHHRSTAPMRLPAD